LGAPPSRGEERDEIPSKTTSHYDIKMTPK